MKPETEIKVKPYMQKEISEIYGIGNATMRAWIKKISPKIGQRYGRYYTVKQVEIIFREFGVPYKITNTEMSSEMF
jgi:transposase